MHEHTSPEDVPPFIYRSTHLHEADLVVSEFERLDIAFHRAIEGPAGVRWAMPLSAAWAPGTCFLVIVPGPHSKRAADVVNDLPVTHEATHVVWQPGMTDADKEIWRTWAWVSLAAFGLGLVGAIAAMFTQ